MTTRTPEEIAREITETLCAKHGLKPESATFAKRSFASAIRSAVAAETERCAGIADEFRAYREITPNDTLVHALTAEDIASAIRAKEPTR